MNCFAHCLIFLGTIVSAISHCESNGLLENSARYDVTLYVTMF